MTEIMYEMIAVVFQDVEGLVLDFPSAEFFVPHRETTNAERRKELGI
jgi:hypothetical protein